MDKVIIEAVVSGFQLPSLSQYIPITPDDIANEIVKCWQAGAAVAQYQARNPQTGEPVADVELFREVATKVKKRCDIVLCLNTEGSIKQTVEERLQVIPALQPEMATYMVGPNLSDAFRLLKGRRKFKHAWEKEYLEASYKGMDPFSFALPAPDRMEKYGQAFAKYQTRPEIQVADPRDLDTIDWMTEEEFVKEPVYLHFILGDGLRQNPDYIGFCSNMAKEAFRGVHFAVAGAGKDQMAYVGVGLALGGHARVGIGDSFVDTRGELVKSSVDQVKAAIKMIDGLGYVVATPKDAREMLALKGMDKVNF